MNCNLPLVSIVIPVYNGSNFLREAIESALAQTYPNIEVLVINDGSSDDGKTEEIALSYGDKIKYYKKENGGVSSALNLGIAKMKGQYFSWLSHDDKYAPEKIDIQIKALSEQNDKDLIALCSDRQINKNSEFIGKKSDIRFADGEIVDWEEVVLTLLNRGTFNGCALLIPSHIFEECGVFDITLRYNQDAQMWFDIFLTHKKIIYQSSTMVFNRIHEAQVTQTRKDLYHSDCEKMSVNLLSRLVEASDERYNFVNSYALYNAKYNNKAVVKKVLQLGKCERILSRGQILKIKLMSFYGFIRPTIRQLYYRIFKSVRIQTK